MTDYYLYSDSNSGAKGEADFVAVPPPPPSIHTGTQKGEGLTNTSKPSVSLYSQLMPCATEARTSHLTRHKPPSLTLNRPSEARLGSRLVALSRPLLCDTSATRKLIPNPMVVASAPLSTMCDLPKAVPGDGLMTTLAASVPTFASVTSAVKQEATGIINGVTVPSFTPAEELPPKKKIRGSGMEQLIADNALQTPLVIFIELLKLCLLISTWFLANVSTECFGLRHGD